jgi:hypothetical protein
MKYEIRWREGPIARSGSRGVPSDRALVLLLCRFVPGASTLWDCEQKRVPAGVTLMHLSSEVMLAHAFPPSTNNEQSLDSDRDRYGRCKGYLSGLVLAR